MGVKSDKALKTDHMKELYEAQRSVLRAHTMIPMWTAREARLDVLGPFSLLSRRGAEAEAEDSIVAEHIAQHLKATKDFWVSSSPSSATEYEYKNSVLITGGLQFRWSKNYNKNPICKENLITITTIRK